MKVVFYFAMLVIAACGVYFLSELFITRDMVLEKTKEMVGPIQWEQKPVRIEGVYFGVFRVKESGKRYLYMSETGRGTVLEAL